MTWPHRERMLTTMRGGMPDRIPYAPRLDLWFTGNKNRGTLPPDYRDFDHWDQVSRKQGWAIAKVVLEYQRYGEDSILDRPLGIYRFPAQGFYTRLPADVERTVKREGDLIRLEYHTPKGTVRAAFLYSEQMPRSGVTLPWISEHALKGAEDYAPLRYLFENFIVEPAPQDFASWAAPLGEDGYAACYALTGGSPMHHIMKILMDGTQFYFHHRDYRRQMEGLAESIGVYFRKVFQLLPHIPAEIFHIGANFDDTITYPPFFRDHIMPWLQEAADLLHPGRKYLMCHTDGENRGLMDSLYESGLDVADSVCPAPMTKVSLAEYYSRWGNRITLQGGIPSNLLLAEATTEAEFENFLDDLFQAVAPGNRLILGVADTVPPDAVFDRLLRIADRVEKEGKLPIEAGAFRPATFPASEEGAAPRKEARESEAFQLLQEDLFSGLQEEIKIHVHALLAQGGNAQDILHKGLLAAMEKIGQEFKHGHLFVPEVLLAARALNEALAALEPYLAGGEKKTRGKVLMGTVQGDLHDIGKNMVSILLRGVGFEVIDLGINIPSADFIKKVSELKPDILGMSALLTTTMPRMKTVIEGLGQAGLRKKVKVLVGGAPVSRTFARQIGADGYAADAGEAVEAAKLLMR